MYNIFYIYINHRACFHQFHVRNCFDWRPPESAHLLWRPCTTMELTLLQKLCSIHSKDFKRDKQNKTLWTSVHCGPEEGKNLIQHGKNIKEELKICIKLALPLRSKQFSDLRSKHVQSALQHLAAFPSRGHAQGCRFCCCLRIFVEIRRLAD